MQRERIPVRLFIIAAAEDAAHQTELEKHLVLLWQQGLLENWQSRQPGEEAENALVQAKLIVLLLSADFNADGWCQEHMQRVLERQQHGEVKVVPILLRPVEVTNAPFTHLAMVPTNGQAVTLWSNQDAAWTHIAEGIRCVLEGKPLPVVQEQKEAARYAMENQVVQGPVMGEHNMVHQHFYAPTSPPPASAGAPAKQVWMVRQPIGLQQPDYSILGTYLESIVNHCQYINSTGIAKPTSLPLLSLSMPLEKIFIHVRAISDRPRFDMAIESERREAEIASIRKQSNMSYDEREEQIARLKAERWQSELSARLAGKEDPKKIEDVLASMKANDSVSILLGGPGAGKSTTLRWLALQTARAIYSNSSLPKELVPAQIPILIRISDYAHSLEKLRNSVYDARGRAHLVKDFLQRDLETIGQALPKLIWEALADKRCLVLFDGLDEVANDGLRRQVTADIYAFINRHCVRQQNEQQEHYNRILITSRIVGYEPGPLSHYRAYTLLDLTDELIADFLTYWCPAVEMFLATRQCNESDLTESERLHLQAAGKAQRDMLLQSIREKPNVSQLAINPFMLTILALITRSSGKLPYRRIDLYKSVVQTLLNDWNQTRGGKHFNSDEIKLAENILSTIAFHIHSNGPFLTHQHILQLAHQSTANFLQKPWEEIRSDELETFMRTLSESSGLFVELGQGLYGFMHRTLQEYFAARSILNNIRINQDREINKLVQFVRRQEALWREPFLLAVAYLGDDNDERIADKILDVLLAKAAGSTLKQQVSALVLATDAIIEARPQAIKKELQTKIAEQLLACYKQVPHSHNSAITKSESEKIENAIVHWLLILHKEAHDPPLLNVISQAIKDTRHPNRQRNVLTLLILIAKHLELCSPVVFAELIPPLLALTGLPEVGPYKPSVDLTVSADFDVADLALSALSFLGKRGPSGLYLETVRQHFKKNPEQLRLLARCSVECGVLIYPVMVPVTEENYEKHAAATLRWMGWPRDSVENGRGYLQCTTENIDAWLFIEQTLLEGAEEVNYPAAMHLLKMLDRTEQQPEKPWLEVWQDYLREQLNTANYINYQEVALLWDQLFFEYQLQQPLVDVIKMHCKLHRDIRSKYSRRFISYISGTFAQFRYLAYLGDLKCTIQPRYLKNMSARNIEYFNNYKNFIYFKRFSEVRCFEIGGFDYLEFLGHSGYAFRLRSLACLLFTEKHFLLRLFRIFNIYKKTL